MIGRILIADDSLFWREQLRTMLEGPGWIVFEARDGSEAVRKAQWIHPDVVILDMSMPVLDGLGAARQIKEEMPEIPILIVTVDKTAYLEVEASWGSSGLFQDAMQRNPQLLSRVRKFPWQIRFVHRLTVKVLMRCKRRESSF